MKVIPGMGNRDCSEDTSPHTGIQLFTIQRCYPQDHGLGLLILIFRVV